MTPHPTDSGCTSRQRLQCILCGKTSLISKASIPVSLLIRQYAKAFQINIAQLVAGVDITLQECQSCGLRVFAPISPGDSHFYTQLQQYPWYYQKDKTEYRKASEHVPPMSRVLDVGCGYGEFAKFLDAGSEFTGLELNKEACERAKTNGRNVICQTVEAHIANNAACYDVVCSFQVLEHVPNPAVFLSAQLTALKKGGRLMICVPNADSYLQICPNNLLNLPPHHITHWAERTLAGLQRLFPLKLLLVEREDLSPLHRNHYLATLIAAALRGRLHDRDCLIANSFLDRLAYYVGRKIAKRLPLENSEPMIWPCGQTVLFVYEKL